MEMKIVDYSVETERLIIRSLKKDDYENWINSFENRYLSQNRHDKGKIDMSECTLEWFHELVNKHQKLARSDNTYIFGHYRRINFD